MSTEANMLKEATIQITGMTCAACSARIEKVLNKMDGVEQAGGRTEGGRRGRERAGHGF